MDSNLLSMEVILLSTLLFAPPPDNDDGWTWPRWRLSSRSSRCRRQRPWNSTVAVSSLLRHVAWLSQVKTRPEARPTCTYSGAARQRRETKDKLCRRHRRSRRASAAAQLLLPCCCCRRRRCHHQPKPATQRCCRCRHCHRCLAIAARCHHLPLLPRCRHCRLTAAAAAAAKLPLLRR